MLNYNSHNKSDKTKFYKVDNSKFVPFNFLEQRCNRCDQMVKKDPYRWISKCKCKNLVSFFKPTPIQQVALNLKANIIFDIGAVGSGKTTISSAILSMRLRLIPGAKLIAAAQTYDQLQRNAMPELEKFFHESEFEKKNKDMWILNNGSIIEFWPSDDADKLRSANANFIWLIEAHSHQMQMMFNEATSRIRNSLGMVYEYNDDGSIKMQETFNGQLKPVIKENRNLIIVEGNPKKGAWFSNKLMQSHSIYYTTNVKNIASVKARSKPIQAVDEFTGLGTTVDMVAILNASFDNPMLDQKYFINMRASVNSDEEYDQKVYCDITSQDGLVFKKVVDNPDKYFKDIQQPNLFDTNNYFVESFDPGGAGTKNDPDAYIIGLFNKQTRRLQVLDCFKLSGLTLEQSSNKMWELRRKWGWTRERHLVFSADNALGKGYKQNYSFSLKSDYEIRLGTGIVVCNEKGLAHTNAMVNNWYDHLAIEINKGPCEELIKEIYGYEKYQSVKSIAGSDAVKYVETFTEVNNHLLDALRYLIVILEGYGFKQDSHLIELNKKFLNHEMMQENMGISQLSGTKFDLRSFLPGGSRGPSFGNQNSKIKL